MINDTAVSQVAGKYKEQLCVMCEKPITLAELAWPGGLQCLDFGLKAHRGCYNARYSDGKRIDQEKQAGLWGLE